MGCWVNNAGQSIPSVIACAVLLVISLVESSAPLLCRSATHGHLTLVWSFIGYRNSLTGKITINTERKPAFKSLHRSNTSYRGKLWRTEPTRSLFLNNQEKLYVTAMILVMNFNSSSEFLLYRAKRSLYNSVAIASSITRHEENIFTARLPTVWKRTEGKINGGI